MVSAYVDVEADAPIAAVGDVASFGSATLVGFPMGVEVLQWEYVGGEGNPAVLASPLDGGGVAADAGDADGGMGLLVGLEPEAEAEFGKGRSCLHLVELAVVFEGGPRLPIA